MYKILKEYRPRVNKNNYFIKNKLIMTGIRGFYCPNCLKKIPNADHKNYWYGDDIDKTIKCENCNKDYKGWKVTSSCYNFINYSCVKYDEEKGLLAICFSKSKSVGASNFILWENYLIKCVMNLKTHNSYLVKSTRKNGKEVSIIKNINNSDFNYRLMEEYTFSDCINSKHLKQMFNFFFQIYKNLTDSKLELKKYTIFNLKQIVLDNRYGFLINADDKRGKNELIDKIGLYPSNIRKYIPRDKKTGTLLWINDMVSKNNLPSTKAFRKLYFSDIQNVLFTIYFKEMGFNNPDIILSLLKECNKRSRIYNEYSNKFSYMYNIRLFKKMIKRRGESVMAKELIALNGNILYDTIMMFENMWKTNKGLLDKSFYSLSIKKFHDKLSELQTQLRYENKEIKYSKKEKALNEDYNDIHFEIAKDTNTLVLVGQEMGICVGGYRNKALSKGCTIVTMKDNDEYVGCIELNKSFNLIQVKAKFNNPLDIKYKDIFEKWTNKHDIDYKNCYDYESIGHRDNESTWDYHELETHDGQINVRYA